VRAKVSGDEMADGRKSCLALLLCARIGILLSNGVSRAVDVTR
jgi:hypothetical protein